MKKIILSIFIVGNLFADQGADQSIQTVNTAQAATITALTVAQALLVNSCVTPTPELQCNSSTSMIASALSPVISSLASSAAGGNQYINAGITAALGAVSCQLIKCDTTAAVNAKVTGVTPIATYCPVQDAPGTSADGPDTCIGGAACLGIQTTMNTDYVNEEAAFTAMNTICSVCAAAGPQSLVACPTCDTKQIVYENLYAKYETSKASCNKCVQSCLTCQVEDDAVVNSSILCKAVPGAADYNAKIAPYKARAKARQAKCIRTCDAMVAAMAAINVAAGVLTDSLKDVKAQTSNTTGNNNGYNYNSNNSKHTTNNNKIDGGYDANNNNAFSDLANLVSEYQNNNSLDTGADASTGSSIGAKASLSSGGASSAKGKGGSADVSGKDKDKNLATTGLNYGGGVGYNSIYGSNTLGGKSSGKSLKGLKGSNVDEKDYMDKSNDLIAVVHDIHTKLYKDSAVGVTNNVVKKKVKKGR